MIRRMVMLATVGLCFIQADLLLAQAKTRLVFDQAHGQQPPPGPLGPVAKQLGLEVQASSGPITAAVLEGARILYLRAPSQEFTAAEAAAIIAFVKGGGSLLLVLDEERRQPLATTRVNDFIGPFGMKLTLDTEYSTTMELSPRPERSIRRIERFLSAAAAPSREARRSHISSTRMGNRGTRSGRTPASKAEAGLWCLEKAWRHCSSANRMASGFQGIEIT